MQRQIKMVRPEIKVLDERAGRIHAVVSTEDKDRDGDIIRVAGWKLESFMLHPVMLSSHKYGSLINQIGHWEEMSVKRSTKQLEGVAQYYVGQGNEEADWGFNLARWGKAAYSVGFIPDMAKAVDISSKDSFFPNYEFNGQELLEVSHVTVPANANALQTIKDYTGAGYQLHPILSEVIGELLDTPAMTLDSTTEASTDGMAHRGPEDDEDDEDEVKEFAEAVARVLEPRIVKALDALLAIKWVDARLMPKTIARNDYKTLLREVVDEMKEAHR